MSNILTPISLWSNFDVSLDIKAEIKSEVISQGVKIEKITFLGRDTGNGRVKIAAAFASEPQTPVAGTVLIMPDSTQTIDEGLLKFIVKHGYAALMVDYRGEWEDCAFHTEYPENIAYANTAKCGRRKDYVDTNAQQTSWYEWAGVGLYARKYITERTGSDNIALLGLRDGGEIVWKMGVAEQFSCIVPVCAAGWKAYAGVSKYLSKEISFDEERYRFIGGIDSQAYAPYVRCPVLMLCSTNDERFDYDRAYDTFSRINATYITGSAISYSVRGNSSVGAKSVSDMFLFLDKHLKKRQVFIPRPAEVAVEVDESSNLIAKITPDNQGVVEECNVYLSEDSMDSALRDWLVCPLQKKTEENVQTFFLNIYEKTSTIFVLCSVKYSNGFTVWSKMTVKKISGKFRNMQSRCRVLYSSDFGADGFSIADPVRNALGGIFFTDASLLPAIVEKAKGIKGLYCSSGLSTYRLNNPRFAPASGNMLAMDVYCDKTASISISVLDLNSGEEYINKVQIIGGVWQNTVLESKAFKTASGVTLENFAFGMKLKITCAAEYAVNNVMWL